MATVKLPAGDADLLGAQGLTNSPCSLRRRAPGVWVIRINRPRIFNCFCRTMRRRLWSAFRAGAARRSSLRRTESCAAAEKIGQRPLASIIQGQTNVSDVQKTELGLTVRRPPTIAPPPADSPTLWVESVSGVTAKVRIGGGGSTGRARPGVDGVVLFSFVGDEPPTDLAGWKIERLSRRLKIQTQFPASTPPGARVWFTAQFFNSRKQTGPLSAPIGANLPGGGVVMTTALARAA